MSSDLTALDATKPDGATQQVSVLDDYERETRLALKDWSDTEHSQKGGRHQFPTGSDASRPATSGATPAETGAIYRNTDRGYAEFYDGANWVPFSNRMFPFPLGHNMDMELWGAGGTS